MIVSHLLLILHKKIQFYIFMFEAWNVARGRKVQGGRILSQGTVYWDNVTGHVTLRLHTGGLYLTNNVTSEGNWLHQILFWDFMVKEVKTYARTTFFFVLFFSFHFTNLDYFVYVRYMKSK